MVMHSGQAQHEQTCHISEYSKIGHLNKKIHVKKGRPSKSNTGRLAMQLTNIHLHYTINGYIVIPSRVGLQYTSNAVILIIGAIDFNPDTSRISIAPCNSGENNITITKMVYIPIFI